MTQVGLGTVQLGAPYGNNARGELMPEGGAHAILQYALDHGVKFFDTAQAYGESEARLGTFGLAMKPGVEVSTKVPRIGPEVWQNEDRYFEFLRNSCEESKRRLRVDALGLLQFHQCEVEFLNADSVRVAISRLLETRICSSIGISVYEPAEAEAAMQIREVSALQIPLSVVDTRFLSENLVSQYRHRDTRVIARSIFMQGVLIPHVPIPPVKKQKQLSELREHFCKAIGQENALDVCLQFALCNQADLIETIILGVDSLESLVVNLRTANKAQVSKIKVQNDRFEEVRAFAAENGLLNPARWNI